METMQHRKRSVGENKTTLSTGGAESWIEKRTTNNNESRQRYYSVMLSISLLALGYSIRQEYQQSHPMIQNVDYKAEMKKTPIFCALFQVYNHVPRYEEEVLATISRLKRLNPQMTTILVTDNPELRSDTLDVLHPITPQKPKFLSYFGIKDFTLRLWYLSTVTEWAPSCDIVLSLDSHVTVCSSNLYQQLEILYRDPNFSIGTNVEHAPPWNASPMTYMSTKTKHMPHNFAICIRPHAVQEFMKAWYTYMQSWSCLLQYGTDDQQPLAKLLLQSSDKNAPKFTRLKESLVLAEKSIDKKRFGFFPRFTYVFEGNVTLMHSYRLEGLPATANDDICSVLNQRQQQQRPRMLVRMSQEQKYEILTSVQDCKSQLGPYEPRICTDPAQVYGLQDPTHWK